MRAVRVVLPAIAFAIALPLTAGMRASADAAPISKCDAAKKKCLGKYVAAQLGCHAKAESKGVAVDPACLAKGVAKITGRGKGCFDKLGAAIPNDCSSTNDASTELGAADYFIGTIVQAVDPDYPAPTLTRCGAARKKCVAKAAAGVMGCSAKASKDGVGDAACVPAIEAKLHDPVKGCDPRALAKGTDCLGTASTALLETQIGIWAQFAEFRLEGGHIDECGDGINSVGESCDASAPSSGWKRCGPDFACIACNCACPSRVVFTPDATSPTSLLDAGWTGLSHRTPVVANGDVTMELSACTGTSRPCGQCTMSGPVRNLNAGAGQLDNQRCSHDSSIKCTDDTPCLAGGGTCEFHFGAPLPLAAGGVTTCVSNRFEGPVVGSVNIESGEARSIALLTSDVFNGIAIDNPCPRCTDLGGINDGVNGGTCDAGPRAGLPCDANGSVPGRPDFGRTSLDCPSFPGARIASLLIDLSSSTDTETRTLTTASPNCGLGAPGEKCLCSTCNTLEAYPCLRDADCPESGGAPGICGGARCIGGTNAGAPCTTSTACPGAGICGRPGEPPRPSACLDDSTTVGILDCADDGTGEGTCTMGPLTSTCSVASGHAQRGCLGSGDCGGASGSCESDGRRCFLTGGGTFQPASPNVKVGTDTLTAVGVEDTPVRDVANPTLASVFCLGPTGSPSVNNVAGLPGPARLMLSGTAVGVP